MQIKARLVDPPVDTHPADNLVKDKWWESKNMGEGFPNFDAVFCIHLQSVPAKFWELSQNFPKLADWAGQVAWLHWGREFSNMQE